MRDPAVFLPIFEMNTTVEQVWVNKRYIFYCKNLSKHSST